MDNPTNLVKEMVPTYTTVRVNNKHRRVRHFGAVRIIDKFDKIKIWSPEGYLYIKNEPRTRYTSDIEDTYINKQKAEEKGTI